MLKELAENMTRAGQKTACEQMVSGDIGIFEALIVISQGAFYHTGILESRNFCKLLGIRRLAKGRPAQDLEKAHLAKPGRGQPASFRWTG